SARARGSDTKGKVTESAILRFDDVEVCRGAEQCRAGKAAPAWSRYRNPLGFAFREIQSL
ncbi:MAG: hypothetical protein ACLQU5_20745, partial [Isosphaeraceae bacterium]